MLSIEMLNSLFLQFWSQSLEWLELLQCKLFSNKSVLWNTCATYWSRLTQRQWQTGRCQTLCVRLLTQWRNLNCQSSQPTHMNPTPYPFPCHPTLLVVLTSFQICLINDKLRQMEIIIPTYYSTILNLGYTNIKNINLVIRKKTEREKLVKKSSVQDIKIQFVSMLALRICSCQILVTDWRLRPSLF